MLKTDHEKIVKVMRRRHAIEIAERTTYLSGQLEECQRVRDTYAAEIDKQDRHIVGLLDLCERHKIDTAEAFYPPEKAQP